MDDIFDAIKRKDVQAISAFIADGVDINAAVKGGVTPLHQTAFYGHSEIAEKLIAAGANVRIKDAFGRTPLHWAKKPEVAKVLISAGASLEDADKDGNTPMDMTISKEVYEVMIDSLDDTES